MRTKLISLLVALCAAGNLLAADFKSGDLYYNIGTSSNYVVVTYEELYSPNNYKGLTSVVIPSTVTYKDKTYQVIEIGTSAFYGCTGLTSITIPDGVTSIGYRAFYGCTGLTSITIPDGVTSIGSSAFYGVFNIVFHGYTAGSPWGAKSVNGYIENYLVYGNTDKTTLLACSTAVKGAITIPNSITRIEERAFWLCSGLTSISLPNSVTHIGDYAFQDCTHLTSITIPYNVTRIGGNIFTGCSGLTEFYILAQTPPVVTSSTTFDYVAEDIPIYIPCGTISAYKSAVAWKNFTNYIELFEYELEVKSEDSLKGSIRFPQALSCTGSAIFEAVANKGYRFVRWNDGNTDNPRTVIVDKDTTFTAEFGVVCTISATCDLQRGIVTGGGTYDYGTQITLQAIPNSGYEFSQWSNGQTYNPYRFTALEDLTIEALFVPSTAVENVRSDSTLPQKVVRNGQVLIERGEKTYTTMGIEVE